jgi:hypothetical protein
VNFVEDPGSHGNADVLNEICSIGSTLNHNFQGSGKDDACKIITVAVGGVGKDFIRPRAGGKPKQRW